MRVILHCNMQENFKLLITYYPNINGNREVNRIIQCLFRFVSNTHISIIKQELFSSRFLKCFFGTHSH